MAYNSALDDFKPRDPKKGDSVLTAHLDVDGQVKYDSPTQPAPVTLIPGAGTSTTLADSGNDGRKDIAATGTPEALAASQACLWVTLTAVTALGVANTGIIYVGINTPGPAVGEGIPLNGGDSVSLDVANLNLVWLRTTVNGEGVAYLYGNKT